MLKSVIFPPEEMPLTWVNKLMLFAAREGRGEKNCDRDLAAVGSIFKTEATAFSNTDQRLSRQITYFFFPYSVQIDFLILLLPPHKQAALCKCSKLTDVVKRISSFNIVVKSFFFRLSCLKSRL